MEFLQPLDAAALRLVAALNPEGGAPLLVNAALARLVELDVVKMGPLVLMLVYLSVRPGGVPAPGILLDPPAALRSFGGSLLALVASRVLQTQLPARPRPRVALPGFPFPPLLDDRSYDAFWQWSSMPSDHAILAAALAAAIWMASRRLGVLAAAWAIGVVCLPRIYLGFHYASDILAGLLLGAAVVLVAHRARLPRRGWSWLAALDARSPALVVVGLFALGFEITELFDTVREIAHGLAKLAAGAGHHAG